jgi:hypothetical protein
MSEHFLIAVDGSHLRIFTDRAAAGQWTATREQVYARDFAADIKRYARNDTDQAGRFQSSKGQGAGSGKPAERAGMSVDERLPMREENEARRARALADEIEAFLGARPDASWDFAAGPQWNHAVLELLSPAIRQRLKSSVDKNLINELAAPRSEGKSPLAR